MKLITTFPLEHYDNLTFGPLMPPRASKTHQSYSD